MEKEKLIALGTQLGITISDELADKILAMHKETLDNQFVPKSRFDEVNEKNKTLTTQLSERDASIAELKKNVDDKASKDKIAELEQQLANKDKEHALQLASEVKKVKIISEIAGKVHDNDLVVNLLNMDDITVNDNGTVIGLNEQLETLKQTKGFLFKDDKKVTTPPANNNQNNGQGDGGNANTNPAAGYKSPNVSNQQNGESKPEDKIVQQRDNIIAKMVAKQKLNQSKNSKGEE